jgi:hypothetical protein
VPQDWFAQFAPQLAQIPAQPTAVSARISSGDDWFAQNDPTAFGDAFAREAGVRAQIDELPRLGFDTVYGPIVDFAKGAAPHFNPLTIAQGIGTAVLNPLDTVLGAAKAGGQQIAQAFDAYDQGRYMEAGAHGAAGMIPLVGPAAAQIGERLGEGVTAGGLGDAAGFIGSMLVPGALARNVKLGGTVPGLSRNLTAADRAAIAAGEAAGVPIDAATATGNNFVRSAQHMADRSIGGSTVAARAARAQADGLASMGEQLAAKGYAQPVTMEQAGAGAQSAVLGRVQKHHATANDAYAELRRIEALEENAMTVAPKLSGSAAAEGSSVPAPRSKNGVQRFAKEGGSTNDLFQGVLGDARRNGFAGSADELRAEFLDRLASAKSLGIEMSSGAGGAAELLADIRRLGGLRPWVNDYQQGAKAVKQSDEFKVISGAFERNHGMRGGGGVMREDGLYADDLFTQLQQEGKWLDIRDAETLIEKLNEIARDPKSLASGKHDLETLLNQTGVKPGEKWWKATSGEKVVQLPVALGEAKAALEPLYQELKWQAEHTPASMMGDKARAYNALAKLLNADDFVSLSRIDAVLGDLKSFARTDVPELATAGQGAVKQAIKQLDAAVMQAAEVAGPEAVAALKAGRQATIAKYVAADILKDLERGSGGEGVKMARGVVAPKDATVGQLRELAKQAPAELPKIGRAVLDDLLKLATENDSFDHAARIATSWRSMGPETKLLLYKDPGYIKDLDNFFHLAKMTAVPANSSLSASAIQAGQTTAAVGGVITGAVNPFVALGGMVAPWGLSKFLHSATGARLLSQGFKIPRGNKSAIAKYRAELAAFAQKLGTTNPNERQTGTTAPVMR